MVKRLDYRHQLCCSLGSVSSLCFCLPTLGMRRMCRCAVNSPLSCVLGRGTFIKLWIKLDYSVEWKEERVAPTLSMLLISLYSFYFLMTISILQGKVMICRFCSSLLPYFTDSFVSKSIQLIFLSCLQLIVLQHFFLFPKLIYYFFVLIT